jgi:hypothetical protein
LIFWALVPNHNVRYALPLSPGLMGLGVMGLIGWWLQAPALRSADSASRLRRFVGGFLALWLVAKVAFVEVAIPHRSNRNAPAIAAELRGLIPPNETAHLLRLKDEGVMFYYGRPALRCRDPLQLPRPAYVLLIQQEWDARAALGDVELVKWMYDQQGDPLIVARVR